MSILRLNWRGLSYDDVDTRLHELSGVPLSKKFVDLPANVFKGTIPKSKDALVYDAMEFAHTSRGRTRSREEIERDFSKFRSTSFLATMLPTDKPLHGRRYKNQILFDVSAYEDSTHERHLQLLERLARIWQEDGVRIELYSILKDIHGETHTSRDACTPFVRDHIAFLMIWLPVTKG
jgi:hypothetical protein